MGMREDLRALLRGAPAIASAAPGGIDWMETLSTPDRGFIVLQVISETAEPTQDGRLFRSARVQVDCYAPGYAAGVALGNAVAGLLDGYRGGRFTGVMPAGRREGRDDLASGARLYRQSIDYIIYHQED